jgi:hypothetical protein
VFLTAVLLAAPGHARGQAADAPRWVPQLLGGQFTIIA